MAEPVIVRSGDHRVKMSLPHHAEDLVQGRIFSERRFYERDLLEHTLTLLEPGDLVIDVGAYIGNHALFWACVMGNRVLAFEPNEQSYALLEENLALNEAADRVVPYSIALGAEEGRAGVRTPDTGNRGNSIVEPRDEGPVRVRPLDALELPAPVRLMKVDVQGMELDVLRGAARTIRRDKPYLYVEATTGADLGHLITLLSSWGYVPRGQFGSTPTVFFVDREDARFGPGAQVAMTTHLLQTTMTSTRGQMRALLAELTREQGALAQTVKGFESRTGAGLGAVGQQLDALCEGTEALRRAAGEREASPHLEALGDEVRALRAELARRLVEDRSALDGHLRTFQREARADLEPMAARLQAVQASLASDSRNVDFGRLLAAVEQTLVDRIDRIEHAAERARRDASQEERGARTTLASRLDVLERGLARLESRAEALDEALRPTDEADEASDAILARLTTLDGQLARLGLSIDTQLLHARRVEAELVGLKHRMAADGKPRDAGGPHPTRAPALARVSSLAQRALRTRPSLPPRSRKKLRKLLRDPENFFADAKSPRLRAWGSRLFSSDDGS